MTKKYNIIEFMLVECKDGRTGGDSGLELFTNYVRRYRYRRIGQYSLLFIDIIRQTFREVTLRNIMFVIDNVNYKFNLT